jgi:hypothetical protein
MQSSDPRGYDAAAYRSRDTTSGRKLPKLYRGRAWLGAVTAVLTELVVIAAVDNQSITHTLRKPLHDHSRVLADYSRGAIDAATTYSWRFAEADGQPTHVWAAQFAAIGVLVLLTWLGMLAIARGSVTFGRVWVGTWALVAAVAPISIMVRNVLITPTAPGPAQSKIGQAVYGFNAFGPVIVAGLVLGLAAGLLTAAVTVSAREHIAAAEPPPRKSDELEEYYDETFAGSYDQPGPYQARPWGESQWPTSSAPQPGPAATAPTGTTGATAWSSQPPQPTQPSYGWPPAAGNEQNEQTQQFSSGETATTEAFRRPPETATAPAELSGPEHPAGDHAAERSQNDEQFVPTPHNPRHPGRDEASAEYPTEHPTEHSAGQSAEQSAEQPAERTTQLPALSDESEDPRGLGPQH